MLADYSKVSLSAGMFSNRKQNDQLQQLINLAFHKRLRIHTAKRLVTI